MYDFNIIGQIINRKDINKTQIHSLNVKLPY